MTTGEGLKEMSKHMCVPRNDPIIGPDGAEVEQQDVLASLGKKKGSITPTHVLVMGSANIFPLAHVHMYAHKVHFHVHALEMHVRTCVCKKLCTVPVQVCKS